MAVLLREALGDELRRLRTDQGRTLREVSTSARVSLGYLSEVERGQKEASSELLAAICSALEVPVGVVLTRVGAVMTPAMVEIPMVIGAAGTPGGSLAAA
ncbi:MAG: helix-turn-helix transcriptional regulator [Gordonia sp. (in: high G+C Gram-positive bacteria)]|uniref:helix-turn-helix domain-containing protein n=1 Tax=Gordonia sp. (in: high G+C Gram-positive bacteria) TaxID=84139 RepID=UPI003BB4AE49